MSEPPTRILIVDDHDAVRRYSREVLEPKVTLASSRCADGWIDKPVQPAEPREIVRTVLDL